MVNNTEPVDIELKNGGLYIDGVWTVGLTKNQFGLMCLFANSEEEHAFISYFEIISLIYNGKTLYTDRDIRENELESKHTVSCPSLVTRLKKILDMFPYTKDYIKNVPNYGYKLNLNIPDYDEDYDIDDNDEVYDDN